MFSFQRFFHTYTVRALTVSSLCTICSMSFSADLAPLQDGLGKGVECLFAPSEFYRPGAVYRIDNKRIRYWTNVAIAEQVNSAPSPAVIPALNGSATTSAGLIASLFNLKKDGTPLAELKASFERKRKVYANFEDVKWTITEDTEIDKVLSWFSAYDGKRPKNRYYVVREAYSAAGGKVTFDKSLGLELGGQAAIDENVKVNPSLSFKGGKNYELSGPFPARLNVCIKAEEIVASKAGAAGPQYATKSLAQAPKITADHGAEGG